MHSAGGVENRPVVWYNDKNTEGACKWMKGTYGLAHIAVYTAEMEQSIAFYEALGGKCTMRGEAAKPKGVNRLAMVDWAGLTLELIEPHDGTDLSAVLAKEGVLPHFAVEVDDLETVAAKVRAAGVADFLTERPNELPNLFGGVRNWFLTGPSGEKIELIWHKNAERQ